MIVLSFFYKWDNNLLNKLDVFFTGRLKLANDAFKQYGIKMFGTAFEMIGRGGTTVERANYNFVDSSYCLILVRYGLALLILICVIHIWISCKGKNKILISVMALIAIHSMIEHHYLELAFNPFILIAFADISEKRKEERGFCIFKL